MNKNTALIIAGIVFGLVALFHLIRIYFSLEITVAGAFIPIWMSWIGFIITFILCLLMFVAHKKL